MSLNENWPRWIFASISEHVNTNKSGIALFIEGEKFITSTTKDRLELRINGPRINEIWHDAFSVEVTVNILVSCTMTTSSFHTLHTNVGIACGAFSTIGLYQYGTLTGIDTQALFGCLSLKRGPIVTHYGQINPAIDVVQATVEGHYKTILEV